MEAHIVYMFRLSESYLEPLGIEELQLVFKREREGCKNHNSTHQTNEADQQQNYISMFPNFRRMMTP